MVSIVTVLVVERSAAVAVALAVVSGAKTSGHVIHTLKGLG
jgi:hypothetical protein